MASTNPTDHQPDPAAPAADRRVPWTLLGGFLLLAANFALCVRRAEGDRGAIAFAAFSYLNLLLLFWSIRRFEKSAPGSPAWDMARLAVWLLATSLTAAFTWKVSALMPLPLAAAAWVMAAATVAGGLYGILVHDGKRSPRA